MRNDTAVAILKPLANRNFTTVWAGLRLMGPLKIFQVQRHHHFGNFGRIMCCDVWFGFWKMCNFFGPRQCWHMPKKIDLRRSWSFAINYLPKMPQVNREIQQSPKDRLSPKNVDFLKTHFWAQEEPSNSIFFQKCRNGTWDFHFHSSYQPPTLWVILGKRFIISMFTVPWAKKTNLVVLASTPFEKTSPYFWRKRLPKTPCFSCIGQAFFLRF